MATPVRVESSSASGLNYEDLSFSQIDPEVISELPPEIRREVERHFEKRPSPQKAASEDFPKLMVSSVFKF